MDISKKGLQSINSMHISIRIPIFVIRTTEVLGIKIRSHRIFIVIITSKKDNHEWLRCGEDMSTERSGPQPPPKSVESGLKTLRFDAHGNTCYVA